MTSLSNLSRAHNFLRKNTEVYAWDRIEVGPKYYIQHVGDWFWTIFQRSDNQVVNQSHYLDEAIGMVLDLDDFVILPDDVADYSGRSYDPLFRGNAS